MKSDCKKHLLCLNDVCEGGKCLSATSFCLLCDVTKGRTNYFALWVCVPINSSISIASCKQRAKQSGSNLRLALCDAVKQEPPNAATNVVFNQLFLVLYFFFRAEEMRLVTSPVRAGGKEGGWSWWFFFSGLITKDAVVRSARNQKKNVQPKKKETVRKW